MDEGQNRNGGMSGGSFSSLNNPNSGQSAENTPVNNAQPVGGNAFGNRAVGGTGFSSFSNNTQGFGSNMNAVGIGTSNPGMISSVPDSVDVGGGDNKKRNKIFAIIAAVAVLALIVGVSVIAATGGNFGGGGGSSSGSGGSTTNDSGKKDDNSGKNDNNNTNNDVEEIVISDETNSDFVSLLVYGLGKNIPIDKSDSRAWYFYHLLYAGISDAIDTEYIAALKKSYEEYWKNNNGSEYKKYNQYFSVYSVFANRNSVLTVIDGLEEGGKAEYVNNLIDTEQYSSVLGAMAEVEKQYFLNNEREVQFNRIISYIDLTWDDFAEMTNNLGTKKGNGDA